MVETIESILYDGERGLRQAAERIEGLGDALKTIANNQKQLKKYEDFKKSILDPERGLLANAARIIGQVNDSRAPISVENTTRVYEMLVAQLPQLYKQIENMPPSLKSAWASILKSLEKKLWKAYASGIIHSNEPNISDAAKDYRNRYSHAYSGKGLNVPNALKKYLN